MDKFDLREQIHEMTQRNFNSAVHPLVVYACVRIMSEYLLELHDPHGSRHGRRAGSPFRLFKKLDLWNLVDALCGQRMINTDQLAQWKWTGPLVERVSTCTCNEFANAIGFTLPEIGAWPVGFTEGMRALVYARVIEGADPADAISSVLLGATELRPYQKGDYAYPPSGRWGDEAAFIRLGWPILSQNAYKAYIADILRIKWVCQRDCKTCDGYFQNSWQKFFCPLYQRPLEERGPAQLEYRYDVSYRRMKSSTHANPCLVFPKEERDRLDREHENRYAELCRAFAKDLIDKNRWSKSGQSSDQERAMAYLSKQRALYTILPPAEYERWQMEKSRRWEANCGGDCRNCPFLGEAQFICPYTQKKQALSEALEADQAASRAKIQKLRAEGKERHISPKKKREYKENRKEALAKAKALNLRSPSFAETMGRYVQNIGTATHKGNPVRVFSALKTLLKKAPDGTWEGTLEELSSAIRWSKTKEDLLASLRKWQPRMLIESGISVVELGEERVSVRQEKSV